jgi:phage shock protein E
MGGKMGGKTVAERVVIAGLVAVLAWGTGACARAGGAGSGSAAAHEAVAKGARLVDVRTTDEFADGHLDGAVNIPVQDLEARLAEVGPKDKPVVVYCRSGGRSARAKRLLEGAGYTSVIDLGGIGNW